MTTNTRPYYDANSPFANIDLNMVSRDEIILKWLVSERKCKTTSIGVILNRFCPLKDMLEVLKYLVKTGKVDKLAAGYRPAKQFRMFPPSKGTIHAKQ